MGVAVSDRPVGKRITDRYQMEVPPADSTADECEELRPKLIHVLLVLRGLWRTESYHRHPRTSHQRFQSALSAQPVHLIGVRPPVTLEEQLRVIPMPTMRIAEIGWVSHPQSLPWPRPGRGILEHATTIQQSYLHRSMFDRLRQRQPVRPAGSTVPRRTAGAGVQLQPSGPAGHREV